MNKIIGIQMTDEQIQLIDKASSLVGRSRSNFIKFVAHKHATEVIANGKRNKEFVSQ